ncbi:MAG: HAMP domain-containing sensor histidine kinase [Oscillospiraceae bacterium]
MSIKRKILISNIIMLVVPVLLILLLTVFMVAVFVSNNPELGFAALEEYQQTSMFTKFIAKYFVVWGSLAIIVTGVTAMCITMYLSNRIIQPLKDLRIAMEHIKVGDLDYEFSGSNEKELKEVCVAMEDLRLRLKRSVESELAREKEQKMLIANISHDLKTPITSIKGYIEGIKDGVADTPEKMEKYLTTVLSKTEIIESMVENLSLYSHLELSRLPYEMKILDICEFLKKTLNDYTLDLQNANITLKTNITENVLVKFDEKKMHRVFGNIIGNSIKYKKDNSGTLNINTEITKNGLVITFEDTGVGIKESDIERVFEGFYRSDPSRNSGIEGNGLGLSITRRIIADHGGKIWLRSEEGLGTEIIILLPIVKLKA